MLSNPEVGCFVCSIRESKCCVLRLVRFILGPCVWIICCSSTLRESVKLDKYSVCVGSGTASVLLWPEYQVPLSSWSVYIWGIVKPGVGWTDDIEPTTAETSKTVHSWNLCLEINAQIYARYSTAWQLVSTLGLLYSRSFQSSAQGPRSCFVFLSDTPVLSYRFGQDWNLAFLQIISSRPIRFFKPVDTTQKY